MSITNNKFSAFSLIELSIVLIIMGLLVAGITGGASLIDNARITSLKREIDDYVKDVFTFYARVGRLPGDLDNTGRFGYASGMDSYPVNSFSDPYHIVGISPTAGPFIELYLYEVSSFKPTPPPSIITTTLTNTNVKSIADGGGIPFSKVYKDFMYVHRWQAALNEDTSYFINGMQGKTAMQVFTTGTNSTQNKKTVDIIKKTDIKYDDGAHNTGNMRSYCGNGENTSNIGKISYTDAKVCSEIAFFFDVK
jgi:prepilin-type N-terminal cleavage/methylation domain-containing protein